MRQMRIKIPGKSTEMQKLPEQIDESKVPDTTMAIDFSKYHEDLLHVKIEQVRVGWAVADNHVGDIVCQLHKDEETDLWKMGSHWYDPHGEVHSEKLELGGMPVEYVDIDELRNHIQNYYLEYGKYMSL